MKLYDLPELNNPEPLKLTCSSTDCEVGQHYYGPIRRGKTPRYPVGACIDCGERLVDWQRIHRQSSADVDYLFEMLRTECWRHHYWHLPFDDRAVAHARHKGRRGFDDAAVRRIRSVVGKAAGPWDGQQVRRQGNILWYAQHATATCCRRCINYWHGIAPDRPLSDEDVVYLADLTLRYIDYRWPDLNDEPLPRERRRRARPANEE